MGLNVCLMGCCAELVSCRTGNQRWWLFVDALRLHRSLLLLRDVSLKLWPNRWVLRTFELLLVRSWVKVEGDTRSGAGSLSFRIRVRCSPMPSLNNWPASYIVFPFPACCICFAGANCNLLFLSLHLLLIRLLLVRLKYPTPFDWSTLYIFSVAIFQVSGYFWVKLFLMLFQTEPNTVLFWSFTSPFFHVLLLPEYLSFALKYFTIFVQFSHCELINQTQLATQTVWDVGPQS